jgi:hypothetical protein
LSCQFKRKQGWTGKKKGCQAEVDSDWIPLDQFSEQEDDENFGETESEIEPDRRLHERTSAGLAQTIIALMGEKLRRFQVAWGSTFDNGLNLEILPQGEYISLTSPAL